MIDFETLKFFKVVEDLVKLSNNEIIPFSEITEENREEYICYDENAKNDDGSYKIVLDMCLDFEHHDIIGYLEECDEFDGFVAGIVIDEEGKKYVNIRDISGYYNIVVEDGRWYFA